MTGKIGRLEAQLFRLSRKMDEKEDLVIQARSQAYIKCRFNDQPFSNLLTKNILYIAISHNFKSYKYKMTFLILDHYIRSFKISVANTVDAYQ